MRAIKKLVLSAILLLVVGCANPYAKFYHDYSSLPSSVAIVPYHGEPKIIAGSGDAMADVRRMYEQGYRVIGEADFVAPATKESAAVNQAKAVGAAIVLVSRKYQGTASGVMPITTPTTTTAFSSGNVNAYGPYGTAYGNYSGTTTVYGSQTTYVPYSVDRYGQHALFFAPMERKGIGIFIFPANDDQKKAAATNQVAVAAAIRQGSPAFKADILPGDLILSLDGNSVADIPSAVAALGRARGHEVRIDLLRNGQRITKTVMVPDTDW